MQSCYVGSCSTKECVLSDWSQWAACSTTCGAGQKRRERAIVAHASDASSACKAALSETLTCVVNPLHSMPCGVRDCEWNEWTDWWGCSTPCGGGQKTRQRHIKVAPSIGGKPCLPKDKDE